MNENALLRTRRHHSHPYPFDWCETNCFKFSCECAVRYCCVVQRVSHRNIFFILSILFIIYWLVYHTSLNEPGLGRKRERERETRTVQQNNNKILSMCAIIYFLIFRAHISLAAWDSFRFIHIPHEIVFDNICWCCKLFDCVLK